MTEDLLERRLADAMHERAARTAPAPTPFAAVERRAARLRRRRAAGAGAVGVGAAVLLVVGVLAVASTRTADDRDLLVGPADTTSTAPVPGGDARWPVFEGSDPIRAEPAVEVTTGVQSGTRDPRVWEVTPYLFQGPNEVDGERYLDDAVLVGLEGDRWTVAQTFVEVDGPTTGGAVVVVSGSAFDPTRVHRVPNPTAGFVTRSFTEVAPSFHAYQNARPEALLAAPTSRPIEVPVEHIGSFDWIVVPSVCPATARGCSFIALGGDADHVIRMNLTVPVGFDGRDLLATLVLRGEADLPRPPEPMPAPDVPDIPIVMDNTPIPWQVAGHMVVQLPEDDPDLWPEAVADDYCTAYRQWTESLSHDQGAYGSEVWTRWVTALGEMAPPDVGDSWAVLAAEEAAGRDTTTTEPGMGALKTVVTDGDARCPR